MFKLNILQEPAARNTSGSNFLNSEIVGYMVNVAVGLLAAHHTRRIAIIAIPRIIIFTNNIGKNHPKLRISPEQQTKWTKEAPNALGMGVGVVTGIGMVNQFRDRSEEATKKSFEFVDRYFSRIAEEQNKLLETTEKTTQALRQLENRSKEK